MATSTRPRTTRTIQLTLDDARARDAQADALRRVDEHADPEYKDVALAMVKRAAQLHREFTTDQVLELLQDKPVTTHEGRVLGAIMRRAKDLGYIVPTPRFTDSASVSRHRAPKRVWASQIYGRANN